MVQQDSNLETAFSQAKRWHACENYERRNLPCPLRLAKMEEDDEEPDESLPVPTRQPSPLRDPIFVPPVFERRRIPRTPPNVRIPVTYPVPIPLPPPTLVPNIPPPPPMPPLRPIDPVNPPPDEGPEPRYPDNVPDRRVPRFPLIERMHFLPDGLPIPPSDPMDTLRILKENNLGDDLPDPDDENLTLNYGEVYSVWIPRLLNLAFKNMQPLWIPGLSRPQQLRGLSGGEPAANLLLDKWVAASRSAEMAHIESLLTQTEQSTDTEQTTDTGFIPPRFTFRNVATAALGGAALAATGAIAQRTFGGFGGFQNRGAEFALSNPGMVR